MTHWANRKTAALAAVSLVVALAVLWVGWRAPSEDGLPTHVALAPSVGTAPVRSMQDTQTDGQLREQQAGPDGASGLVVDAELRRFFDYHLSALGERTLDEIDQQAQHELERRLSPSAAAHAKRLWGLYLAFKRALVELEQQPQLAGSSASALRARLQAMQALRGQYFDQAQSQAMFGFDDAYDQDAISRLEVNQDKSLSEADKHARLAALDAARTPELRDAHDAPLAVVRLEQTATQMRQGGASDDEVYRLRAQAFNPEAAARLAEVDRDLAQWQARITAYLQERDALLRTQAKASEETRQAALVALRERMFNSLEQRRLAAYE